MNINEETSKDDIKNEGDTETFSIPVIRENIAVDKTRVEKRKVRIVKKVNEENQLVNIPLAHDEIEITTVPVNQFIDEIPQPVRYEGDTMIIPVLKEVSVVRILLEKEIHITKKTVQTTGSQNVSLRTEEVIVENVPSDNNQ